MITYHPNLSPLIHIFLGAFNGGFPLFGVMFFAIFSFYLLVIVVKGSFKLGIRFLFWKVSFWRMVGWDYVMSCHVMGWDGMEWDDM